ncbi:hypothetical protein GCM10029964_084240 [Kibdelosporangium lantanae]
MGIRYSLDVCSPGFRAGTDTETGFPATESTASSWTANRRLVLVSSRVPTQVPSRCTVSGRTSRLATTGIGRSTEQNPTTANSTNATPKPVSPA